jgi:type II secretory pathway component PulJ
MPSAALWNRRGYTLLETTVALGILAAGFVMTAQALAVGGKQRQAAAKLMVAQLEAANTLEQIAAMPFDDVTSATLAKMKLSEEAQATLIGGELFATVENSNNNGPPHKRVHVEVAWPMGEGPKRKVELTAWKYE